MDDRFADAEEGQRAGNVDGSAQHRYEHNTSRHDQHAPIAYGDHKSISQEHYVEPQGRSSAHNASPASNVDLQANRLHKRQFSKAKNLADVFEQPNTETDHALHLLANSEYTNHAVTFDQPQIRPSLITFPSVLSTNSRVSRTTQNQRFDSVFTNQDSTLHKSATRQDLRLTSADLVELSDLARVPGWVWGAQALAYLIILNTRFADLTWVSYARDTTKFGTAAYTLRNDAFATALLYVMLGRAWSHAPSLYAQINRVEAYDGSASRPYPHFLCDSFQILLGYSIPAGLIFLIQELSVHVGNLDVNQEASIVLAPSNLWVPQWNTLNNGKLIAKALLNIVVSSDSLTKLREGGQTYITYDLIWGSLAALVLAMAVGELSQRRRLTILSTVVVVSLLRMEPVALFTTGVILSDLRHSGHIRALQDGWLRTTVLELALLPAILAILAAGNAVMLPLDKAFGHFLLFTNRFGYNASEVWPRQNLPSNVIAAAGSAILFEISHTNQWFLNFFAPFGRLGYPLILISFIVLYGILPHYVLHLAAHTHSYWSIVSQALVLMFVLLLLFAWLFRKIIEQPLKTAISAFTRHIIDTPLNTSSVYLLGTTLKGIPKSVVVGTTGFIKRTNLVMTQAWQWRSPGGIRSIVGSASPANARIQKSVISTLWTADLSDNPDAQRTARLLFFNQWTWVVHIFLIPGCTAIWWWFHPFGRWTWDALTFTSLWRFAWALSLPNCLIAYLGFCTPDRVMTKSDQDLQPVVRQHLRHFYILLVSKGSNASAVRRAHHTLSRLEPYHPAIKVMILTDEPYVFPDLKNNVVCPKEYQSPFGRAKFKARALDYFRTSMNLTEYDWILHMDEESETDAETIRRCFDFIRYTKHAIGQGIILYNSTGYFEGDGWIGGCKSWFFSVADCLRVGDDLARFNFQNNVICRPIFGVHGSFLLVNGQVENDITWDCSSLAEDYEFSHMAWAAGYTCGRVHGIVREQSPLTLHDFLKQRRRWFCGIRGIKGLYGLPRLAINLWVIGMLTLMVTIVNIPLSFLISDAPTPFWIALIAAFCFFTFIVLYLAGWLFQELDKGTPILWMGLHLCAMIMQPLASLAEGLAAIWALSSEQLYTFDVIVKR